jgi:hypothetical protein
MPTVAYRDVGPSKPAKHNNAAAAHNAGRHPLHVIQTAMERIDTHGTSV